MHFNMIDVFQSMTDIILFMFKLLHLWPVEVPLSWLLSPFDVIPEVLVTHTFLLVSGLISYISCAICNQPFLQGANAFYQ